MTKPSLLRRLPALLVLGCAAAGAPGPAPAGQPTLMVHPTKVLFEGRDRGAVVNLINRGDGPGTFLIEWVDYRMTEEGGLFAPEDSAPWSLQPHARLSPRRVRLEPGGQQIIRLALRPSADVQRGEYYSHLRVLTVADESEGSAGDEQRPDASAVRVTARTAMAIPIVWRNTRARPEAALANARFDRESGLVMADVQRIGETSVRGSLRLVGPGSSADELAEPVPVVIYPNLDGRTFSVPLSDLARQRGLAPGTRLVLASRSESSGRETVLASLALER